MPEILPPFRDSKRDVEKITFSDDGKFAATADDDHIIRLWSTQTWQQIAHTKRFSPRGLVFSDDSRFLAVRSLAGGLELLTADNKFQATRILPGREASDVILHPRFFFLENRDAIRVWETSGGKELPAIKTDGYSDDIAISWDGSFVATLHKRQKAVRIYSVAQASQVGEFTFQSLPYKIALSRNGKYLAAISKGRGRVWDLQTGQLVAQALTGQSVQDIAFTSDGR